MKKIKFVGYPVYCIFVYLLSVVCVCLFVGDPKGVGFINLLVSMFVVIFFVRDLSDGTYCGRHRGEIGKHIIFRI